jgi:prepilin-type N-terminal cleavage/methylation domain-containing protein
MTIKKGFTLIELLVVIGIMAVLAAGVVALINPREKTLQANDSNMQNTVGQIAGALQSYAAQQPTGTYPTAAQGIAILTTSGELAAAVPAPPAGSVYTAWAGNYVVNATQTAAGIYQRLASAKYTTQCAAGVPYWMWNTTTGRACGFCGAAAPVVGSACSF